MKTVKTPCIGICSTVFGDEVCRGCKRFVHEVIDWNTYSYDQKLLVKNRLDELAKTVLINKVCIADRTKFEQSLRKVELDTNQSDVRLILEFLRKAAKQIDSLTEHGLQVFPSHQEQSPEQIKDIIDNEIHILSTATYHRNFKTYNK